MAATYHYVIQDASTNEYLTPSNTWNPDIALAQTYNNPTDAKDKMDTLTTGYYVMRYIGIVS
jgi:hypothetical protein